MNLSVKNIIKYNLNWDLASLTLCQRLGGLSNDNYKLIYKNKEYFLRVCHPTNIHTDKALELKVITKASDIGLCKKPIYYEVNTGHLVSPWLHGTMPTEECFASIDFINLVTEKLRKLHNLTHDGEFNLYDHIKNRIDLCKKYLIPLPNYIDDILKTMNELKVKLDKNKHIGLCHNDLNPSNMIFNKKQLYFVDYEYASMGDVFFDLATLAWFMSAECRKLLLKSYFGHYKDEYYKKLLDYLYIVKLYNATWSLLKSRDSNGDYDYLKGANMIFEDLLNFESINT